LLATPKPSEGRVTGHLSLVIFYDRTKKTMDKSAAIVSEIRLLWGAQAASLKCQSSIGFRLLPETKFCLTPRGAI
jgi:hypothetical protein